jgi:hypothetical protein
VSADLFIDDLDSSSAQAASPSAAAASGGGRVRVVYSDSLALVHKFATFETHKPYSSFHDALKACVRRCYALDPEIRMDEVLPTTVRAARAPALYPLSIDCSNAEPALASMGGLGGWLAVCRVS